MQIWPYVRNRGIFRKGGARLCNLSGSGPPLPAAGFPLRAGPGGPNFSAWRKSWLGGCHGSNQPSPITAYLWDLDKSKSYSGFFQKLSGPQGPDAPAITESRLPPLLDLTAAGSSSAFVSTFWVYPHRGTHW